ncbi:hypothetical protein BRDID11002_60830 [Bradyrhizobium diazoefficiens]
MRPIADLHNQRRESIEGGRTVYTEPDRIIIRDPGGQAYVRGNDLYRFRYGGPRQSAPTPSAAILAPS